MNFEVNLEKKPSFCLVIALEEKMDESDIWIIGVILMSQVPNYLGVIFKDIEILK